VKRYSDIAIELLQRLVTIPSTSFNEEECSLYIYNWLKDRDVEVERRGNNIISKIEKDSQLDTLVLNSHIDTVDPSPSYSFDPYNPPASEDMVLGLGSNDAGGSVVSMIATFLYFNDHRDSLPLNLILALSCEEERGGAGGMKMIASFLKEETDYAIIGEPTGMKAAVAERGLLVIDGESVGRSAHAARSEEGINAISIALKDIELLQNFVFDKVSPLMGAVNLNVTQISAGTTHNVIPDICRFVVDIRPTECYTNEEIMALLSSLCSSSLKARNLTNRSSATPAGHKLLERVKSMGIEQVISPTTSDWMRITIPAIKMGPGESPRSHKADEYIYKIEIEEAVEKYIDFIRGLN
jgi:acetylornithine deacetylase